MKTIKVTGLKPTQKEAEKYCMSEIEKSSLTDSQKKEEKNTLFMFLFFIVLLFLIGLGFAINGKMIGMLFWGGSFLAACISIPDYLRKTKKHNVELTNPNDAFNYFWEKGILANPEDLKGNFAPTEDSILAIQRIMPVSTNRQQIETYINEFRQIITEEMRVLLSDVELLEKACSKALEQYVPENIKYIRPLFEVKIANNETNIDNNDHLSKVEGFIKIKYCLAMKKANTMPELSQSIINISEYYIKSKNGFWFPFDITPNYEVYEF